MKKKLLALALAFALLLPCLAVPAQAADMDRPSKAVNLYVQDLVGDMQDFASLPLGTLLSPRGFFIVLDQVVTRLVQGIITALEVMIPSARPRTDLKDYKSENFLPGQAAFVKEGKQLSLGYDSRSILPADFGEKAYRMGGYDFNKLATETYDDLRVRTVVMDDGTGRGAMAFAVLDVIGLANSDVRAIRAKLADMVADGKLAAINVSVTHTHSAIDSQGLWGNDLLKLIPNNILAALLPGIVKPIQGVDQTFLNTMIDQTEQSIRAAYKALEPGDLVYSKRDITGYLSDKIAPYVMDNTMYRLCFAPYRKSSKSTLIASFGAHPERVGWITGDNPGDVVSADFIPYIEEVINKAGMNFLYIQGPVGTRISYEDPTAAGLQLNRLQGTQHFGRRIGEMLLDMASLKQETVKPFINVALKEVLIEAKNPVLKAVGKLWLVNNTIVVDRETGRNYAVSEVGYLELGDSLKILLQPGETSPELLLGGPNLTAAGSVTGKDYPYPPLRACVDPDLIVFDMVNDSIGYIIPDCDSTDLLLRYIDGELTDKGSVNGNFNDALLLTFSNHVASTVTGAFLALVGSVR